MEQLLGDLLRGDDRAGVDRWPRGTGIAVLVAGVSLGTGGVVGLRAPGTLAAAGQPKRNEQHRDTGGADGGAKGPGV